MIPDLPIKTLTGLTKFNPRSPDDLRMLRLYFHLQGMWHSNISVHLYEMLTFVVDKPLLALLVWNHSDAMPAHKELLLPRSLCRVVEMAFW